MRPLVADGGDVVVLVKPQFEVGRERLGRSGVVTSPHERASRAARRPRDGDATRPRIRAAAPSPIRGGDGQREFLLWLVPRDPSPAGLVRG